MSWDIDQLKNIIEGALMAANQTLSLDRMLDLFEADERPSRDELRNALEILGSSCDDRGVELKEVGTGFRIQVKQEYAPWVGRLWDEKPARYSRALLETLALIAYQQPITRGDIEAIRGVAVSSYIIKTLLEREWVRIVGHKDVPGRPAMYASTKQFLDYFNMRSLDELPSLAEIREFEKVNQELNLAEPNAPKPDPKDPMKGSEENSDTDAQEAEGTVVDGAVVDGAVVEATVVDGSVVDGSVIEDAGTEGAAAEGIEEESEIEDLSAEGLLDKDITQALSDKLALEANEAENVDDDESKEHASKNSELEGIYAESDGLNQQEAQKIIEKQSKKYEPSPSETDNCEEVSTSESEILATNGSNGDNVEERSTHVEFEAETEDVTEE
ncbi:MAG: SMC-Scp complex subunit ScpB [Gammaproteobacteria bacterium]|nr:MAG: SMC-Scp complex subunit ScpB [Gammaproteobacteria bacterium]